MTWTYDTSLSAAKDQVRLLIGDTDKSDEQLQDEEIAYLVSSAPTTLDAAADAAHGLAAKYARKVETAVGDVRRAAQQRFEHYSDLAATLRSRALTRTGVKPYAGGISVADKDDQESDSDRAAPFFTRATHGDAEADDTDDRIA